MRFFVLTAVKINILVFQDVMPCSFVWFANHIASDIQKVVHYIFSNRKHWKV
jgi:hypothetical protein